MIKLSPRLEAIANLVPKKAQIIDIGCDHGLLDVYLCKHNPENHIIASDLRKTALSQATANFQKYSVTDKIEARLGSGLEVVTPSEIDTIIMSGLGTHTIVGILSTNPEKLKNVQTIIIQSNNYLPFLRKKITHLGYYIERETLVEDSKIIYTIIKFSKGKRHYTSKELFFGPCLLKENSPLFQKKKALDQEVLTTIYNSIPSNHFKEILRISFQLRFFK